MRAGEMSCGCGARQRVCKKTEVSLSSSVWRNTECGFRICRICRMLAWPPYSQERSVRFNAALQMEDLNVSHMS